MRGDREGTGCEARGDRLSQRAIILRLPLHLVQGFGSGQAPGRPYGQAAERDCGQADVGILGDRRLAIDPARGL